MNPEDMACPGLKNGDTVRLRSEQGQVEIRCQAANKDDLPRGLLSLPYGDRSSRLMSGDTHGTGMPNSKGIDVELKPLRRGRERASQELLDAIRRKGRTIVFAQEGSEELRLLRYFDANANV